MQSVGFGAAVAVVLLPTERERRWPINHVKARLSSKANLKDGPHEGHQESRVLAAEPRYSGAFDLAEARCSTGRQSLRSHRGFFSEDQRGAL